MNEQYNQFDWLEKIAGGFQDLGTAFFGPAEKEVVLPKLQNLIMRVNDKDFVTVEPRQSIKIRIDFDVEKVVDATKVSVEAIPFIKLPSGKEIALPSTIQSSLSAGHYSTQWTYVPKEIGQYPIRFILVRKVTGYPDCNFVTKFSTGFEVIESTLDPAEKLARWWRALQPHEQVIVGLGGTLVSSVAIASLIKQVVPDIGDIIGD